MDTKKKNKKNLDEYMHSQKVKKEKDQKMEKDVVSKVEIYKKTLCFKSP